MPRYIALRRRRQRAAARLPEPPESRRLLRADPEPCEQAVFHELFPPPDELCAHGPEGRFFHEIVVPFVRRQPAEQPAAITAPAAVAAPGPAAASHRARSGSTSRSIPVPPPPTACCARRSRRSPAKRWRPATPKAGSSSATAIRTGTCAYGSAASRAPCGRKSSRGSKTPSGGSSNPERPGSSRPTPTRGRLSATADTQGIELSEQLFTCDSEAVATMLESLSSDSGADLRWRLALLGIDRLMEDFDCDLEARRGLAERGRATFAGRFKYDLLRSPIADRLRKERGALERLLSLRGTPGDTLEEIPEEIQPALLAFRKRSEDQSRIVKELYDRERRGRLQPPVRESSSAISTCSSTGSAVPPDPSTRWCSTTSSPRSIARCWRVPAKAGQRLAAP